MGPRARHSPGTSREPDLIDKWYRPLHPSVSAGSVANTPRAGSGSKSPHVPNNMVQSRLWPPRHQADVRTATGRPSRSDTRPRTSRSQVKSEATRGHWGWRTVGAHAQWGAQLEQHVEGTQPRSPADNQGRPNISHPGSRGQRQGKPSLVSGQRDTVTRAQEINQTAQAHVRGNPAAKTCFF